MKRFVEGSVRTQTILLPDCLDDYVTADNPIRVVNVFIDHLDLALLWQVVVKVGRQGPPCNVGTASAVDG